MTKLKNFKPVCIEKNGRLEIHWIKENGKQNQTK